MFNAIKSYFKKREIEQQKKLEAETKLAEKIIKKQIEADKKQVKKLKKEEAPIENNIADEKWLKIQLGTVSGASVLLWGLEKELKKYARELGWKLDKVNSHGYVSGIRPKDGKISPNEFIDIKYKLYEFARNLSQRSGGGYGSSYSYSYSYSMSSVNAQKSSDITMLYNIEGSLLIIFKVEDRLKLEKEDMSLAKEVFSKTFEEEYRENKSLKNAIYRENKSLKNAKAFQKKISKFFNIDY